MWLISSYPGSFWPCQWRLKIKHDEYLTVSGDVLMSFFAWVAGPVFSELWQQGREIEPLIACKDAHLLTRSTPEMERYFDQSSADLPRQNGFPVATVMLLLLVAFALNLLTVLRLFPVLTAPLHALLFFAPGLVMLAATITCSFLLARGYSTGLAGFCCLFTGLLLATGGQLVVNLLIDGGSPLPLLVALAALLGVRKVFNGQGFVLFSLYCRTQRLAREVREIRMKSR